MKAKLFAITGILAASLALSACGRKPVLEVAPELQPYVTEFEAISVEAGSAVKIQDLVATFGTLDNPRSNGVCELQTGEPPKITIARNKWDRMSIEKRESLMFHELGHCILGRRHDPATTQDGIPASIMNPYSLDSYIYSENRTYYLAELFGKVSH
jgi:hypothetical protein